MNQELQSKYGTAQTPNMAQSRDNIHCFSDSGKDRSQPDLTQADYLFAPQIDESQTSVNKSANAWKSEVKEYRLSRWLESQRQSRLMGNWENSILIDYRINAANMIKYS